MSTPHTKEMYCGTCHAMKPHYLRRGYSDPSRECYRCPGCNHLVFVPRDGAAKADDSPVEAGGKDA